MLREILKGMLKVLLNEITWTKHNLKCGSCWSRLKQIRDGPFYIECRICGEQWREEV